MANKDRVTFGSKIGVILATVGCAVGLGGGFARRLFGLRPRWASLGGGDAGRFCGGCSCWSL